MWNLPPNSTSNNTIQAQDSRKFQRVTAFVKGRCEGELRLSIIPIRCNGKEDFLCYDLYDLHYQWGKYYSHIGQTEFVDMLLLHIRDNTPWDIPSLLYDECKSNIVSADQELYDEYVHLKPLAFFIKYRCSDCLEEMYRFEPEKFNYLVYLCWQHGVFICTDDETNTFILLIPENLEE